MTREWLMTLSIQLLGSNMLAASTPAILCIDLISAQQLRLWQHMGLGKGLKHCTSWTGPTGRTAAEPPPRGRAYWL
jgi:hypothetical protein